MNPEIEIRWAGNTQQLPMRRIKAINDGVVKLANDTAGFQLYLPAQHYGFVEPETEAIVTVAVAYGRLVAINPPSGLILPNKPAFKL